MTLLIAGLVLWTVFHSLSAMGVGVRQKLINRLSEGGYSGMVAVMIVGSIVMMVFGWRSITPDPVYMPPEALKPATWLLMFFSLLFFIASGRQTRIKQFVRHPQLTGMVLWSVAHLMQAGDDRSLVLFLWLAVWAVLEMIFINRRDGVWVKEGAPGWTEDVKLVAISLVAYAVLIIVHPYISGVTLL